TRFSRDWSSDVCSSDLVARSGDVKNLFTQVWIAELIEKFRNLSHCRLEFVAANLGIGLDFLNPRFTLLRPCLANPFGCLPNGLCLQLDQGICPIIRTHFSVVNNVKKLVANFINDLKPFGDRKVFRGKRNKLGGFAALVALSAFSALLIRVLIRRGLGRSR